MNKFLIILKEQFIYMIHLLEIGDYENIRTIMATHIKYIIEMEEND